MQLALPGIRWLQSANSLIGSLGVRVRQGGALSPPRIATALYRGILEREPDLDGLRNQIRRLRSGAPLEQVVRNFITSPEFRSSFLERVVPAVQLPDLRALVPSNYEVENTCLGDVVVYVARSAADIGLMASLIDRHRYYDRFGVWSPVIDLDKEITAAIVRGLGAKSCFELGCFTGPVISLLADAGIKVLGTEVSSSRLCVCLSEYTRRDALWRSSRARH